MQRRWEIMTANQKADQLRPQLETTKRQSGSLASLFHDVTEKRWRRRACRLHIRQSLVPEKVLLRTSRQGSLWA